MVKKNTKSTKDKTNILEHVSPEDALVILRALAEKEKGFKKRIEQIADEYLKKVDLETIASDVYFELDSLKIEDAWDQSGPTQYDYVEPTDKAWEMFEDTLMPFVEELRKYKKLSMKKEAMIYCMGVLKGIYRFAKESTSKFKDWAEDAPGECFGWVLDEWKKGQKDSNDIAEIDNFIKENFSHW